MILENTSIFLESDQEAHQLADRLMKYENRGVIVVAVSNAGWPIANHVAKQLKADFIFVPSEILKDPSNPLKAIGVVSFDFTITDTLCRDVPQDFIARQAKILQADLISKYQDFYREMEKRFQNKVVILVDQFATTSHRILACLKTIRKHHPERIVIAIPSISEGVAREIALEAEELIFIYLISCDSITNICQSTDNVHDGQEKLMDELNQDC